MEGGEISQEKEYKSFLSLMNRGIGESKRGDRVIKRR
jgi:hypothetical protein